MNAIARRQQILEIVERKQSATVADLCDTLDVSEVTIRRDLRHLSDQQLIRRVHGGAVASRGRNYEPPTIIRAATNKNQKEAIALEACKLVNEGDSIALDVGTTTLALAQQLVGLSNLTIITASLPIANVLVESPRSRLILTGGVVRVQEHSMIGHIAARTYQDFHLDKAFVGVGGMHLSAGLTEYNQDDTLIKQAMMQHAKQIIVLADSSKLGRTCFMTIAPLDGIDILVTDSGIRSRDLTELRKRGVQVMVAAA
ncbi:MAG: DeoR/GlpR transcriptional regulator [Chloroflexota bacterium]|nr:MAG: DeoR/GlpR transcriptional regulator [Chloroflexota bacterium]